MKKISGARNRSYPTSTPYFCVVNRTCWHEVKRKDTHTPSNAMLSLVPLKILVRILVVLFKLAHDILADVAVVLLHPACHAHLVLGGHLRHLPALSHQVEHKLRNVAARDGDVLDGAANDVPLRTGDNMRDAVSRVDDGPRERPVVLFAGRPRRREREHGLHGDVEPFDVERFKEDFSGLLPVFGRVERGLGLGWTLHVSDEEREEGRGGAKRTRRK